MRWQYKKPEEVLPLVDKSFTAGDFFCIPKPELTRSE
jgi:hypothetical protein